MDRPEHVAPVVRSGGERDRLRRLRALALLLVLCCAGLAGRAGWRARARGEPDLLIEVHGAVARPGLHALPAGATVRRALGDAGASVALQEDPFLDLPLRGGYRVELAEDGAVRVSLAGERLLLGLPLDPNTADAALLAQLPGLGPSLSAAIVAERERGGPFTSVEEVGRVRGIGPATLARLAPYLAVDPLAGDAP